MIIIEKKLADVLNQIRFAEQKFGRTPDAVQLLAVTKKKNIADIIAVYAAGQRNFGENQLQEALPKIEELKDYNITWHFIGPIQSNKTRKIAENFAWVHGVDRLKTAERLDAQRPTDLPPLNVCIEVNISREAKKAGISLKELPELAHAIMQFKNLTLRGLMTIPKEVKGFDKQKKQFEKLQQAQQQLIDQGLDLDTLSMGMTADFEAAIAAGSTMVRIGTAIFGERK